MQLRFQDPTLVKISQHKLQGESISQEVIGLILPQD